MNEPAKQTNQAIVFDYSILDAETTEFLQRKSATIDGFYHKVRYDVGKELKEAQEQLARRGYGCFIKWAESIGFKERNVYDLISYFEFLNLHSVQERKELQEKPYSLIREIAKPSSPKELKQAVLNGDITTHKEYQDLLKAQKQAESQAEVERKAREQAERQAATLTEALTKERNKQPEIKYIEKPIKVVEKVLPPDYQENKNRLARLENQLKQSEKERDLLSRKAELNEKQAKEYRDLKQNIENLKREKTDLSRQIESATELSGLVVEIEHVLKNKLAPIKYSRAINEQKTDQIVQRNLQEIISRVQDWCDEMNDLIIHNIRKVEGVIDIE